MTRLTSDYRYDRFTRRLLLDDMRFSSGALAPSDPLPPTALPTTTGAALQVGGQHARPVLLVTGSLTCPMTDSAMPELTRLHAEFGDKVDFVLLSVREAHPGELLPQPHDEAAAREHAERLAAHFDVPFTVAIDTVDGGLHQLLDNKPNAAFLIGVDGRVAFRAHWAHAGRALRTALDELTSGRPLSRDRSDAMLGPVTRAMGSVDATMRRGGRQAQRDLWLSGPPMALAGAVARLLPFHSPDRRGIAAVVALLLSMAAVIAVVIGVVVAVS